MTGLRIWVPLTSHKYSRMASPVQLPVTMNPKNIPLPFDVSLDPGERDRVLYNASKFVLAIITIYLLPLGTGWLNFSDVRVSKLARILKAECINRIPSVRYS